MIHEPIFIIGAPRSGTSILFRSLSMHADLWHLPRESHSVFEGPFHPRHGFASNRIVGGQVSSAAMKSVHAGFERGVLNLGVLDVDHKKWLTDRSLVERVRNRLAMKFFASQSRRKLPESFRLLEKTPKNSLRVSALRAMFPDARFVFLQRDSAQNIDSLLAGWRAVDNFGPVKRHRFCSAGYEIAEQLKLSDYDGTKWKFALIPDWQALVGKSCADVAAAQYFVCNRVATEDLSEIDADRVFRLNFAEFVAEPVAFVKQILGWAGLGPGKAAIDFASNLPRVNDATPHLKRKANELRFPEEVARAMQPWLESSREAA